MPSLQWFQRNLVVKPSTIPNAGMGLFAREDIPVGTRLGWYRGERMTTRQWERCKNDEYIWLLLDDNGKEYYVDACNVVKNNKLRFVNGCITPGQFACVNVEAYQKKDKIWYSTIKKISKGMELVVHYGEDYFERGEKPPPKKKPLKTTRKKSVFTVEEDS